jgi:hypothetical protein
MKVDKDIALPPAGASKVKYPFASMEVGDSFHCDDNRVRQAACSYGKRNDKQFEVRKEEQGFRCWRTK